MGGIEAVCKADRIATMKDAGRKVCERNSHLHLRMRPPQRRNGAAAAEHHLVALSRAERILPAYLRA